MIGVKSADLKAIATTDIDIEHEACEDIENALAFFFTGVRCEPIERSGIVLVYAEKDYDPLQIVRNLVRSNIRCYWAIPIYTTCKTSYEDITKCVLEFLLLSNIPKPIKLIFKCRKRGWSIDSCSKLLRYLGQIIEALDIAEIEFKKPEYVVRLEILGELTGISFYSIESEKEFRVARQAI
ncbi:MAG: THUMP domain-containing protein [Ignisphaera sp.]